MIFWEQDLFICCFLAARFKPCDGLSGAVSHSILERCFSFKCSLFISIYPVTSVTEKTEDGSASLVGRDWLVNIKTWFLLRKKSNWGHQRIFSFSWRKVAKHVSKSGFWGKWTCFETYLNIASIIHQKKNYKQEKKNWGEKKKSCQAEFCRAGVCDSPTLDPVHMKNIKDDLRWFVCQVLIWGLLANTAGRELDMQIPRPGFLYLELLYFLTAVSENIHSQVSQIRSSRRAAIPHSV